MGNMGRLMFIAVMGSALPCWADTYQEVRATITATVQNPVEATAYGCVIEYADGPQEVDCETLEPASGEEK